MKNAVKNTSIFHRRRWEWPSGLAVRGLWWILISVPVHYGPETVRWIYCAGLAVQGKYCKRAI